jgi:glycosyltransferase involved in cell wall biosynthesis
MGKVSLGVPIVCSDIPENRQIMLEDAINFQSGQIAYLAGKLQWVIDHEEEISALALRAKERIRRDYSWDTIASDYAQLHRKITGKQEPIGGI